MSRQFVACKFRIADTRTFTYHNDGEPVAEGDHVLVPDRNGDGRKKVFVVSVSDEAPPFPTKPVLGKYEPAPEIVDDDPLGLNLESAAIPDLS